MVKGNTFFWLIFNIGLIILISYCLISIYYVGWQPQIPNPTKNINLEVSNTIINTGNLIPYIYITGSTFLLIINNYFYFFKINYKTVRRVRKWL